MPRRTCKSEKQKGAEAKVEALQKDGGPFVVAAETTRMPVVFTDANAPGNPIVFANDAFLSLTGYGRDEVLGQSFDFLMERGTGPDTLEQIKAAFENSHNIDPEFHYRRKDGSTFWASVLISPVRDHSGNIVQHFASFVNLTRHKDAQAHSKMLIDELNHRVKNTLVTVQSIVRQTVRTAPDPQTMRDSIDSRLSALARSHDLLTREKWESAGLLDVFNQALAPFAADGRSERIVVKGTNIRIRADAALALGIAFNELATNAAKYGAFSNDAGRILVSWEISRMPNGDRLMLRWRETGGPPVMPPTQKGFGSLVIVTGLPISWEARRSSTICRTAPYARSRFPRP